MDRHDRKLLDKQMGKVTPQRNEGVIVVMLAVMFLVGLALGSVVSHERASTQIASRMD